jgi:hypothetical protein
MLSLSLYIHVYVYPKSRDTVPVIADSFSAWTSELPVPILPVYNAD